MISSSDTPTQLNLTVDWRVLLFNAAIAFGVAILLGLPAAFQVSALTPASALKSGAGMQSHGRLMHSLIALQAGFCFLVLFFGTLFVTTFERLSTQTTGFSSDRVLTLETLSAKPVKAVLWEQVTENLRRLPGVEAVALSEWPLMSGESWNGIISVNGERPHQVSSYFLSASSGFSEGSAYPSGCGPDFRASGELPRSDCQRHFCERILWRPGPGRQIF